MADTVLLVDAYSLIYRAFFAIRQLTDQHGKPANAIYGFTKMLRKLLAQHKPTHAAVVFDLGPPRQRLAVLPSYKAQRPPTPPDLESQLPAIRQILDAMRVPVVEIEGQEADDVIATLARQAAESTARALIASSDKDFAQIVGPRIRLIRPDGKEDVLIDPAAVENRYGVKPEQIVDLLSLVGDSVDNIPGVPGVGEKTAADLLRKYGNIDALLARASEIPKPTLREAILGHADRLRTNRELIRLRTDLRLPVGLDALKLQSYDHPKLIALLQGLGFKSLPAEIEKESLESPDLFGQS
jgi:DNA polymerase-1